MAQRPIWRGHLRLALVSCPVALFSARHDRDAIRFNMINPTTGNRIRMVTQDAETGDELQRRDLVKGYEFKKNTYLILSDEDFDSVKVESSSMMAVEKFVDAGSIDPVYYDASYYLAPDGNGAEDVYAVLREAIARTGKVALTRVVISQRERTIALRPMDGGGVMAHILNEERDLNPAQPLFKDVQGLAVDPDMVALAVQLVERQAGSYDPADLEDRYEARLRAMIEAKLKGEGLDVAGEVIRPESNVVDLMTALRKSLGDPAAPAQSSKKASAGERDQKKAEEARRQPGLKLPIAGGGRKAVKVEAVPEDVVPAPAARPRRKAQV